MASVNKRPWMRPNGTMGSNWSVRWRDEQGNSRQRAFEKKKDADAYKQQVEREKHDGVLAPGSQAVTLHEACAKYLEATRQRVADGKLGKGRLVQVEQIIRNHLLPGFPAKLKINDLVWAHLEDWTAYMAGKPEVAPRTRLVYMEVLSQVEKFAVKRGFTKKRIVTDFKSDVGGMPRNVIRTFTEAEVRHLLTIAEVRSDRRERRSHHMLKCVVHLAAFCGLRRGEIFGLTAPNVDFVAGIIKVRHSLTTWGELKGPKTKAGIRDVPMPPHLAAMLREWVNLYYVENELGVLFRSLVRPRKAAADHQASYMMNFFAWCWRPLLKRAGLWHEEGEQFHFHALRHFAASWWSHNGLSYPDTAVLMGHKKYDTTLQTYAHSIVGREHRHAITDSMALSFVCANRVQEAQETSK